MEGGFDNAKLPHINRSITRDNNASLLGLAVCCCDRSPSGEHPAHLYPYSAVQQVRVGHP